MSTLEIIGNIAQSLSVSVIAAYFLFRDFKYSRKERVHYDKIIQIYESSIAELRKSRDDEKLSTEERALLYKEQIDFHKSMSSEVLLKERRRLKEEIENVIKQNTRDLERARRDHVEDVKRLTEDLKTAINHGDEAIGLVKEISEVTSFFDSVLDSHFKVFSGEVQAASAITAPIFLKPDDWAVVEDTSTSNRLEKNTKD